MAPDDHSARARTVASLEGLRGVRTDALDAGALLVVLNVLGDALRLGVPIPSPLWRPLDGVGIEKLGQAFVNLLAEAGTWRFPAPGNEDDEAVFRWSIQRRDEVESVVLGARRLLLARGTTLDDVEEWRALDAVLRLRDVTSGGARGRAEIEEALGERAAFATGTSWVANLPELDDRAEERPAGRREADGGELPTSPPSDEAIESYLRLGHRAASIERLASNEAAFAEELEAMIDAALEVGMSVGLVARRWRRSRSAPPAAGTEVVASFAAPAPSLARAAADEDDEELEEAREEHVLGRLAPLDCEAVLILSAGQVAIDVFEGATRLREVRLGQEVASAPTEGRVWHISLPRADGTIQLVVTDAEGHSFQDLLAIRSDG